MFDFGFNWKTITSLSSLIILYYLSFSITLFVIFAYNNEVNYERMKKKLVVNYERMKKKTCSEL